MLKLLAKLRQFHGGDPAEYLRTEHRQNLIAIEQALGAKTQETTTDTTTVVNSGSEVFRASYDAGISGTIPISNNTLLAGNVIGNTYYPPVDGDYWIEMGCDNFQSGFNGAANTYNYLRAYTSGLVFELFGYTSTIGSNYHVLSKELTQNQKKITLTKSTGIYFTASVQLGSMSKFYCKITKA